MKKTALVTGANKGLGLEITKRLAEKEYIVFLGARNEEAGLAAAEKLQTMGLDVRFLKLDVTSDSDRKNAFKNVSEAAGKLDVLVNNAGVMLDRDKRPSNLPLQLLRDTFETNFFGLVALTQELLPLLRKSDAGRIVNHSSALGSLTRNASGDLDDYALLAYNSSKAAVNMFTVTLASELRGTPIKVNSVHPGWVKTDMGGSEAPMEIPEGAQTALQLAMLPDSGPSGGFFHMGEAVPW